MELIWFLAGQRTFLMFFEERKSFVHDLEVIASLAVLVVQGWMGRT